jgi:lipopolysaccharide export system permease protein
MLATAGLLTMEDIYKNLHDFIQRGTPVLGIFCYYFWLLVRVWPTVIPISLFLSLLFSLGKLHRNSELVSMRAMGLNIFQITLPLWIAGSILSAMGLFFDAYLSSIAAQKTQDFCADAKANTVKHRLTFSNELAGRVWFIGELNQRTASGSDAMVYFYDGDGNELNRIFAKTFSHRSGIWSFYSGFETVFDRVTHRPSRVIKFEKLDRSCDESPELFLSLAKQPKYLSFAELRRILSFSKDFSSFRAYRVRYYAAIISALSCLLIVFITIPFSTVGVRKNPMVGVAKACAVLFLFYLLSSVCHTLGSNGVLPIFLAISLPHCISLLPVCLLYKRSL